MITLGSALFWFMAFLVMHYVIIKPFMQLNDKIEWVSHFNKLSNREQKFYTSYWHGIFHAIVSTFFALYCFVYADGTPGTNWLTDSYYKLHMFDVQRYAQHISIGFLINRICFNLIFDKFSEVAGDILHLQMCAMGIYVGGFFGSISQLTWLTSLSMIFTGVKELL